LALKHTLKRLAREGYARVLVHTGLWRLIDRWSAPRLVILAGHCVTDPATNGELPSDMKIDGARLEGLLRALGARFDLVTVGEGVARLERAERSSRSMVALSMDDGYRDNATVLPALLERAGAKATVFLESRPLFERRVSWSHKWFWVLARAGAEDATRGLVAHIRDGPTREKLSALLERPRPDLAYQAKRVLKYEARARERDGAVDALFAERGGDERALCERIYMTLEQAHELAANERFELGGHTVEHHVLTTLGPGEAAAEIADGRRALVEELGEQAGATFAYPFGRRWDFDQGCERAVLEAGFRSAVTTHPAANGARTVRTRLGRWMIDDSTRLHLLLCEACGGFELLRRLGLELAE